MLERVGLNGNWRCLIGLVLLLWGLLQVSVVHASWKDALKQRPQGSQVALIVRPLDGGKLNVDYHGDLKLPPASTQKLLTAVAAEVQLGPQYQFTTHIDANGRLSGKVWKGDLRVVFSGAPDFSRDQLGQLIDQLKAQGIGRIDGTIWLDGQAFSGYDRAPGWPWDNLGVCYSAPATALTLDHNCVAGSLNFKQGQSKGRVFVPKFQPVTVTADVEQVSDEEKYRELCELLLDRGPKNHYALHGCVDKSRKTWPLNFAVNDPADYVAGALERILRDKGIVHLGSIKPLPRHPDEGLRWVPMAQVESAPLAELLHHMLQHSDNLYADTLLRTLGRSADLGGSFAQGVRAVKQILAVRAGVDVNASVLRDGSGLSRDDLVSARMLSGVLKFIAKHPSMATYKALPVAGESGTLKYRRSVLQPPLKDNIRAKTGTLNGSHNLAGFMTAESGKRYLFVLMTYAMGVGDERDQRRQQLQQAELFEKDLLRALYHAG